jgi:hypothetical protein
MKVVPQLAEGAWPIHRPASLPKPSFKFCNSIVVIQMEINNFCGKPSPLLAPVSRFFTCVLSERLQILAAAFKATPEGSTVKDSGVTTA